ncbi:MAG: hypothetical protein BGO78_15075 [Chloroflexi bacterium 44-23]|nr:MAG: hypothetical protein BGO78_15075 [Chloroflexi bacterium 44-23]
MVRRDAFIGFHNPNPMIEVEENQQQESTIIQRQPLDLIPTADRKKKRSRKWEQVHRFETVTYRGIPRQVVEQIVEIAQRLSVPRDEVIRAFLEYGVDLYRTRKISLFAYPKAQRMTLFPEGGQGNPVLPSQKNTDQNWLSEAFPVPKKKSIASKKKKSTKDQDIIPHWEMRVTFRIPALLKEDVRAISREHTLPVGEVVWFFVMEGVKAYQNGNLQLQPSPKTIGKTLFQEGC